MKSFSSSVRGMPSYDSAVSHELATAVKHHVCSSEIYRKSTRISLYLSMQSAELSTDDLARQIITDGGFKAARLQL